MASIRVRPWRAVITAMRFWAQERHVLRQGFVGLGIYAVVGLAAGVVLASMEGLLEEVAGLIILVPAAIAMRGAVFGALGARLGTGILTGEFDARPTRGSFTFQNVEAATLLTLFGSALAAVVARAAAGAFDLPTVSLWKLMVVSMVGGVLSSIAVFVVVLVLAATAERRDWDMDAIGAPVITAAGDITTLPALVVGALLLGVDWLDTVLGAVFLATAVGATYIGLANPGPIARRIVRESLPVLTYVALIDVLAGTVLATRLDQFIRSPALLVLIPPFIGLCGSLGGILSARLGSRLHLGLLNPAPVPGGPAALEGSVTFLFAFGVFTTIALLTQAASVVVGFPSPGAGPLVAISLTGGLFATVLIVLVAYYSATASYRFGLDPDNFGMPIVTATMDFLGVLCLVAAIALWGVR
ncbi:MAG TPA: magnesium transporter [Egibacteraceae bacterium]|nr:magnesium transporter [Egibacteraceae bacterium]